MHNIDRPDKPTPFKIIFLKNNSAQKYIPKIISDQTFNIDSTSKPLQTNLKINTPSLIHLSARLQDQNALSQNIFTLRPEHTNTAFVQQQSQNKIQSEINTPQIKNTFLLKKKLYQIQQQRFWQSNNMGKDKNTVVNLIGEIDLRQSNKDKRKISKRLNQHFKGLTVRERPVRKHTDGDTKEKQSKNRIDLSLDFNNFVINQKKQLGQIKKTSEYIQQENRLKKLSTINPQDQLNQKRQKQAEFLDLYRFLPSNLKTLDSKAECRVEKKMRKISSSGKRQRRIDEMLSFYKGKKEQFDWSKLKHRNKKQFAFMTIDK